VARCRSDPLAARYAESIKSLRKCKGLSLFPDKWFTKSRRLPLLGLIEDIAMITEKTVFVLGAGASHPYGLPLGSGLKNLVLANYDSAQGHAVHLYNASPLLPNQVGTFTSGLRFSGLSSVDAFLERRPEFLEVGKATMGIELLYGEAGANPWQDGSNWLTYLYGNMIGGSLDEFGENQVSFVTFNYDRVVEHFFHTSLQNTFGKSAGDTARTLDQIPIIHLHGRVGYLPWQSDRNVVPFGATEIGALQMNVMLSEIKVVHEDITDGRDREFTRAKELIADAARVYLLGFGFGGRNVERLGLATVEAHDYAGTAYGMTSKETNQCKVLCGNRANLNQNLPALEFLRNMATLN
jgi:hypothetical protein